MPATWKSYGVDGNNDGLMDPYNPVDAIFAAARYLKAAGADKDIRGAVFAYNHADWYVDSVLLRAQLIGGLPANLVGSLTGLTEGRFPVAAKATLPRRGHQAQPQDQGLQPCSRTRGFVQPHRHHDLRRRRLAGRRGQRRAGDADRELQAPRQTTSRSRTPTATRTRTGSWPRSPTQYAAPKPQKVDPAEVKRMLALPKPDAKPKEAASDTDRPASRASAKRRVKAGRRRPTAPATATSAGRGAAGQGAPVRAPDALERDGRRRRPAGVPAHRPHRRRAHARPRARPRPRPDRHQEAQGRLAGARRHRARPHRRRLVDASSRSCASRSARPAAAPRAWTRSRSSTAGSCSSRPRSTAPRARTRSSARTPRRRRSARSC